MNSENLERSKKLQRASFLTAIILVSGSAAGLWLTERVTTELRPDTKLGSAHNMAPPPSPEPQIYMPLLPAEAKKENEALPFSNAPLERALPLVLPVDEAFMAGRRNATDCLTSAIYYEAGYEMNQGKRGVAQVILNRVRHPAYPKTICGVVYQGSERKTGCQFTFTCDGSLARRPARDRWEQARVIAISAISGAVEPSVGMATHYHANYVMPYWAPTLDKVSQIGAHIFYRWKGTWGRRRAFSQAIQLDSQTGALATAVEFLPIATEEMFVDPGYKKPASHIIADELLPANTLKIAAPELQALPTSKIKADQTGSKLTIDEKPIIKN
jgi:hypothetical protein